jgi:hypothetical protein
MVHELFRTVLSLHFFDAIESFLVSRLAKVIVVCAFSYYFALVLIHGFQLFGLIPTAQSPSQLAISEFWQITVLGILTAVLHLQMVLGV